MKPSDCFQRTRVPARRLRSGTLTLCACVLASWGCDTGTPRTEIQGVTQSAAQLEEFGKAPRSGPPPHPSGDDYLPYFGTAELITPRYLHRGLLSRTNRVFIFGGSDDGGFSALDTVEIFDQSTFDKDSFPPESGDGIWIDTNFEGDPIVMPSGGRLDMTITELSDNNVIIIGGTPDAFSSGGVGKIDLFDPNTRELGTVQQEMITARFEHTTVQVGNGDLLVVGGRIQSQVTVQNQQQFLGVFFGGTQITFFPTIPEVEVFSPKDDSLTPLQGITGTVSELQTRRGRAGHAMSRLAGPDNRLNTSDDIFLLAGGYASGASSGAFAQGGGQDVAGLTTIEVFDPLTNIFTLITSIELDATRVDFPEIVNLGTYNDFTPDGVRGMGNAVLITGGNNARPGNTFGGDPPLGDQLFIASYVAGGGPARGVRFFEVIEDRFNSYTQNTEYPTEIPIGSRSGTNTVTLPRPLDTVQGIDDVGTWIFALAGADLTFGGDDSPAILAGCVFDPFYSLRAQFQFNVDPTNLETERLTTVQNFLGIVGVWMTMDQGYLGVTQDPDDFGATPANRWARNRGGRRVYLAAIQLPGVDGIRDTFDDRILLAGGGEEFPPIRGNSIGGEPTSPSSEIFLPPGSSQQ